MGVWLPLALASVEQWLVAIVRMFGNDATRSAVSMPKTSEILRGWALPVMAAALAKQEEESEQAYMWAGVQALKERIEKKADKA